MYKRLTIPLIIIVIISLFSTSCRKEEQNQLYGTWEILPIAKSDSLLGPPRWTFNEGNILSRTWVYWNFNVNPPDSTMIYDTAFYFLEQEYNNFFISIYGFEKNTDGNYDIVKMDKNVMILEMKHPFMRKEFKRI